MNRRGFLSLFAAAPLAGLLSKRVALGELCYGPSARIIDGLGSGRLIRGGCHSGKTAAGLITVVMTRNTGGPLLPGRLIKFDLFAPVQCNYTKAFDSDEK